MIRWTHRVRPLLGAAEPLIKTVQPRQTLEPGIAEFSTVRQLIGLDGLVRRLGRDMPIGSGIVTGHVEGLPLDYLPQCRSSEFRGVAIIGRSGDSKINAHVQATAERTYGPGGLAPGITRVDCYAVVDFLGSGYLRSGGLIGPVINDTRLFNHSWIGRDHRCGEDVLSRVDYVIDTHDVVMVAGVETVGRRRSLPCLPAPTT